MCVHVCARISLHHPLPPPPPPPPPPASMGVPIPCDLYIVIAGVEYSARLYAFAAVIESVAAPGLRCGMS